MTDILKENYLHLRIYGMSPVSSEGEGSPIIWPISKTNDNTKVSFNNNLDNDRHFKRETTAVPSPQNLGRTACKLSGRVRPHNLVHLKHQ